VTICVATRFRWRANIEKERKQENEEEKNKREANPLIVVLTYFHLRQNVGSYLDRFIVGGNRRKKW
jgi:hypothetical protein